MWCAFFNSRYLNTALRIINVQWGYELNYDFKHICLFFVKSLESPF